MDEASEVVETAILITQYEQKVRLQVSARGERGVHRCSFDAHTHKTVPVLHSLGKS